MKYAKLIAVVVLALVQWPAGLSAAPISADTARRAVSNWAANHKAAHMRTRMSRRAKDVRTVRADGEESFHVVDLEGGGFVIAAADDGIEPIIAFVDEGTLVEDPKNPLWVLLNLDLPNRMKAVRNGGVTRRDPAKIRGRGRRHHWKDPTARWSELTAEDDGLLTQETPTLGSVSDVRVNYIIQSKWDQKQAGSSNCYNYYTPNNYYCGCVATAGAQVMRFWRFPTASVAAKTMSCWVDNEEADKTMMGGTYDWSNMPLVPGTSTTTTQREAIGKLCYDVGVASRMDWKSGGSGACPAVLADSFVSIFGYANAKCELTKSMTSEKMENTIYANLDAGRPVLLGIHGTDSNDNSIGHEIIADGYGLDGDVIYTHLNLGWSGSGNAWYALPEVSIYSYKFTVLSSVVYNISPDQTGELITGRVLDGDDLPIAGAVVKAVNGSTTRTATSSANGIYALNVTSGKTWSLEVSAEGYVGATASVTVGTSSSSRLGTVSAGSYSYYDNGSIGNRWGNDIVLEKEKEPEVTLVAESTNFVALAVGEAVSFTNSWRRNPRQWLLGGSRQFGVVAADLDVETMAFADRDGYAKASVGRTNEVVVTLTGLKAGEERIFVGRQYKLKEPRTVIEYRVTVSD